MSINTYIVRNTHQRDILSPGIIQIKRSNSKLLKDDNILFLNGSKNNLSNLVRRTNAKAIDLLNQLNNDLLGEPYLEEYRFRFPSEIFHCKQFLLLLYDVYKAKMVVYFTYGQYPRYPSQYVGIRFDDKKNMFSFLLKYGHII
jgi:hypothetical protein